MSPGRDSSGCACQKAFWRICKNRQALWAQGRDVVIFLGSSQWFPFVPRAPLMLLHHMRVVVHEQVGSDGQDTKLQACNPWHQVVPSARRSSEGLAASSSIDCEHSFSSHTKDEGARLPARLLLEQGPQCTAEVDLTRTSRDA